VSYWSELVDELSDSDEELDSDHVADLWILLGSRSEGSAFVALAGVDIAARAMRNVATPVDDRLSNASRRFLRNLVAHSSERDFEVWVDASRRELEAEGKPTDAKELLARLQDLFAEASPSHGWIFAPRGGGKTQLLVQLVADRLSPDETLSAAAELAALHPDLSKQETPGLRSVLATIAFRDRLIDELAGHPRQVVSAEDVADSVLRQARIAGEATATIWEYPMLESRAAAVALGAKPANREKVRTYRDRSWLLGLPKGRGFIYPKFQFDPASRELYDEVRSVNELLGAHNDPWGVASWWSALNDRLGARPVDLVGTDRGSEVVRAVQALLEPVG
jgi:hypothetical protein